MKENIVFTEEVQNLLRSLIEEMGITNYTISTSPAAINGDNRFGVISRATVKGESSGKPKFLNLIVKTAPTNPLFRESMPIRKLFDRETYIYTTVLPEFAKLQSEKKIKNLFKSYPQLHKSIMSDANETLIMEDMVDSNFQLCDRQRPLNYNHVLMVMREYGKYHALSFALRDHKPAVFNNIYKSTREIFMNEYPDPQSLYYVAELESEKVLQALDPVKDRVVYEKFQAFRLNMVDTAKMILKAETAGNHAVINHGDSWTNNLFFKYKDNSKPISPSELCIIDWQLARAGSPAFDLALFFFTCTDKTLRDEYYDHFIQEYYNSLSSFLREFGSDPETLFPFTVLQEHLKRFSVYGLYMAVLALYTMLSESEEIPDFMNMTDLNEATEKLNFKTKNIHKFHKRIRDVILDFDRFGYEFYNNV